MCVLVISNYIETLDPSRLAGVSDRIGELIDNARVDRQPVAFVHRQAGSSFSEIGVRVGRYEPVFSTRNCHAALPAGLIEFILSQTVEQIQLAGVAALRQFLQIGNALNGAGISTQVNTGAALIVSGPREAREEDGCRHLSQFNEYDAFTCNVFDCSASIKNQSTRWPTA